MSKSTAGTVKKSRRGKRTGCFIALGVYAFLGGVAWLFMTNAYMNASESNQMQQMYAIALSLNSYSDGHNGRFPDGKSSTDVFQQLIDDGDLTDIYEVYAPLDGKVPPVPGKKLYPEKKLKPENVGFDYTAGAETNAPDGLPLLFRSGYRVAYAPGATAIPLPDRTPLLKRLWRRLFQPRPWSLEGIVVTYKDRSPQEQSREFSTKWITPDTHANPDGSIPNFVPVDFKPDGKTYRQLTPDGALTP